MSRTVARLLAESLEAHDVDQVYCVPGRELYRADQRADRAQLDPRRRLPPRGRRRLYGGRRWAAARAAPGWRWCRAGRACRTRWWPLHSAYHDATPMVMLVGQVERKDFGRLALQEQNYSRLLSDVTKLVIEVNEPEQASEAIARAFHVAESGTPGPGRGDPARGHFRRGDRRRTRPGAAARRSPGRAPTISTGSPRCWRRSERPLVPVGGALLADAVARPGRASPTSTGSPRNGCCRSTRRTAGRICSTRPTRITAAIWASGCRRR